MNTVFSKAVGTMGLLGISAVALAGPPKPAPPQEPIGFVTQKPRWRRCRPRRPTCRGRNPHC